MPAVTYVLCPALSKVLVAEGSPSLVESDCDFGIDGNMHFTTLKSVATSEALVGAFTLDAPRHGGSLAWLTRLL